MRPLTAKRLIQVLESHGYVLSRQKGSHLIYKQVVDGNIVPVPQHGRNRPIPIGTFLAIVKQSGLEQSAFETKRS